MADKEQSVGAWVDGRVADGWPRLPRPLRVLALLVALLLLVDGLLALVIARGGPRTIAPASAADVRRILDQAADDPAGWLLIGDSVLAGDVMAGRVEHWERERVIDHLAAERAPEGAGAFTQIAVDGLLPVDIDRLIAALDRRDPGGDVAVAIELNLRYFSPHYAAEGACSRPWLCRLGGVDPERDDLTTISGAPLRDLAAALRPWTPVLRHKRALDLDGWLQGAAAPSVVVRARVGADEGAARIAAHYRESDLRGGSAQIQALDRILARLRARGRRALFFTTPLKDEFVATIGGEEALGGRYAAIAERIHDADAGATVVHLDHPLFVGPLFLDHCHLGPAGNRLLALNLLQALDVPLARRPAWTEIIRPEGPHETLIGRLDTGYAEGSTWQALLDGPQGLAVRDDPREVVIADTGNHVLRRLRGALETTELLAGAPGEAGIDDGPAAAARLTRPRMPCFLGDSLYFLDGADSRLRRFADGAVTTLLDAPRSSVSLRCVGDRLWLLGHASLSVIDPIAGRSRTYSLAEPGSSAPLVGRALAVAEDGRIFVVDRRSRIFGGRLPEAGGRLELALIFANTAAEPLPRGHAAKFPYTFSQVRLGGVADLIVVERYGGLLVQDVIDPRQPVAGLTENVHLRYFDLEEERIYPWIKPEVYGQSYVMTNDNTHSLVSGFHQGSMALDQASASLFYVEHQRSRLYRIDDGLYGAARVGHFGGGTARAGLHDRVGALLGAKVTSRMAPHRHLDQRWERAPRRGPFLALMVGASTSAYHDHLGEYSLARQLEEELADALGYRARVRLDLYQRLMAGASLPAMTEVIFAAEEEGLRFDVVFLEIHPLTNHFLGEAQGEAGALGVLGELDALRRSTGMLIVFLDDTSLSARRRDGMRAPAPEARAFMDLAERAGFPVIRPGPLLLREHLSHAAWANQPWSRRLWQAHGSTWGIDLTAEAMASMVAPMVAAYVEGRTPRRAQEGATARRRDPARLLVGGLAAAPLKVDALPALAADAVQVRYDRGHLRVFVDRGRSPGGSDDAVILAALHRALIGDVYGELADTVSVELARFDSYNEYGVGLLSGATIEVRREFDRRGLGRFVAAQRAAHPEWFAE